MVGRAYNPAIYRFGFNGKENINEIDGIGNSIDFGARIYDSRLGRLSSIDPMFKKYPSESNYSYAGGNPIFMIDREGNTKTAYYITIDDRTQTTTIKQVQTNELHPTRINVPDNAVQDYHHEYDWYDITEIHITHIDKDGKVETSVRTNNMAKYRTTTNFPIQTWANFKLNGFNSGIKEGEVEGGIVFTTKEEGRGGDNELNKSAKNPDAQSVDIDGLLSAISGLKDLSTKDPVTSLLKDKEVVEKLEEFKDVLDKINKPKDAYEMGQGLREAINEARKDPTNLKPEYKDSCLDCGATGPRGKLFGKPDKKGGTHDYVVFVDR